MGVWFRQRGLLFWSVHNGKISDSEWATYIAAVKDTFARYRAGDSGAGVTFAYEVVPPNAAQRKALAEVIIGPGSQYLGRHAFYSESVVTRSVLTALDWLVKKPYEERIFGNPIEAVQWASAGVVGGDVDAVIDEIIEHVPASALPREIVRRRNKKL